MSLTVVYYTSNAEEESFEKKIREELVKSVGDLFPIIFVSQKPIDLGENICVGEVGSRDLNALRQLQIGIAEAKTEFVASAEADTLYPREYFTFQSPNEECYRYMNVWCIKKWIGHHWGNGFRQKEYSECAQIVGRDYWLEHLDNALKGFPMWLNPGDPNVKLPLVFRRKHPHRGGWKPMNIDCSIPVVNIKTKQGLRNTTGTIKGRPSVEELPFWGSAQDLRKTLFGEN